MKKSRLLLCIVISISLLVCCVGCKNDDESSATGISVYYLSNDGVKLVSEPYENKSDKGEKLVNELLGRLIDDGKKKDYSSAIPKEVAVLGYSIVDGIATIDFDERYYELNSKRELLCRTAVVLTLIQIEDVEYVAFTVSGKPCKGKDGRYLNAMSESDFVSDIGNQKAKKNSDFTLYFSNENGTALKEYKMKNISYGDKTKEQFIMKQLIKGPEEEGYYKTISSKVKVLSVVTANNICYVDFDENFMTEQSQVAAKMVIYSIVNSLSELDEVHKVQLSVKGETSVEYGDISFAHPFIRNLDIIEQTEIK